MTVSVRHDREPSPPREHAAETAALLAAATADGSRVVAVRLLPSALSAIVVRRTGWLPPRERGAIEVRYWRRGGPGDWFPSRVGLHLDADTVNWLAAVLAEDTATGTKEGA